MVTEPIPAAEENILRAEAVRNQEEKERVNRIVSKTD